MTYKYEFDMEEKSYQELIASLEHWAEMFYEGALSDEYSEQLAYLLYTMAQSMKSVEKEKAG